MRVLVTGARGFVGRHTVADLRNAGHIVISLCRPEDCPNPGPDDRVADICDAPALDRAIAELQPEGCIHLAGVAFVPVAWKRPRLVFDVNVGGTLNLVEALRNRAPACRTVVVSSALVYGTRDPDRSRDEQSPMEPETLYGVSKVAADLNTLLFARHFNLPLMTARPCNHTGPGQDFDFAAPAFARQLAAIAAGRAPARMKVGNLESAREFMDVRDVAMAYRLLLEKGRAGEAYNISTEQSVPVSNILDLLCREAGVTPELEVDPARYRPTDRQPVIRAAKLRSDTGWTPQYTLEQTLAAVYAWAASA